MIYIDREGILLAKYHKIHLFPTETFKNMPPTEELVVVNTDIGRLGLQTCFDLLYKTPGHKIGILICLTSYKGDCLVSVNSPNLEKVMAMFKGCYLPF